MKFEVERCAFNARLWIGCPAHLRSLSFDAAAFALHFVPWSVDVPAFQSLFFANALPDGDFRYFSKEIARSSLSNAIAVLILHGRAFLV